MSHRALLGQVSDTDLRLLRVFQAVVRCGGLTAAELELNIGRSTISRHLKDLEIRLGTTLCHRGRAGFALTDDGVRIFAAAKRLLGAIDIFRADVGEIHDQLRGRLRVAIFDKTVSNPDAHLPEAFRRFEAVAPAVALELHVEPTTTIESGVIDGDFQAGIIPTHRESSSLMYHPLFPEQVSLYCGARHPLFEQADAAVDGATIRAQKYAGIGFHSPNMEASHRLGLRRGAEAHDQEAVATLILSGRYLGFLPDHYAEPFQARGLLRTIRPDVFRYDCEFAAIVRRSPRPSRLVQAFLDCLLQAHAALP